MAARYQDIRCIQSIYIGAREKVVVLGSNASGKSSLLKLVSHEI